MAQMHPRGIRDSAKTVTLPRGSSKTGPSFQMYVNGIEQPRLSSNPEAIKRRLLEDYQLNRRNVTERMDTSKASTASVYPTSQYYDELVNSHTFFFFFFCIERIRINLLTSISLDILAVSKVREHSHRG